MCPTNLIGRIIHRAVLLLLTSPGLISLPGFVTIWSGATEGATNIYTHIHTKTPETYTCTRFFLSCTETYTRPESPLWIFIYCKELVKSLYTAFMHGFFANIVSCILLRNIHIPLWRVCTSNFPDAPLCAKGAMCWPLCDLFCPCVEIFYTLGGFFLYPLFYVLYFIWSTCKKTAWQ